MPRKGVSGSGGFGRPTNFTEAEARVLWENAILVPPAWHLSHWWNVLAAGYAVPPIPDGAELEALIGRRWQMLPMHERENTPRQDIWLSRLQRERQAELGEFADPTSAGTTSSASASGGRTGTSTTSSGNMGMCRHRRAAPLPVRALR
jgi:hypothetical protein